MNFSPLTRFITKMSLVRESELLLKLAGNVLLLREDPSAFFSSFIANSKSLGYSIETYIILSYSSLDYPPKALIDTKAMYNYIVSHYTKRKVSILIGFDVIVVLSYYKSLTPSLASL
jgi:hypothetical protein